MKTFYLIVLLQAVCLFPGCAASRQLVLDPVGPAPLAGESSQEKGGLLVYSAFDVHPDFTSTDPERRRHSDFKILAQDGHLVRIVHNDTGRMVEGPVLTALEPGKYRIEARANGFGLVTVPVVVARGRSTVVHLEGGGDSAPDSKTNAAKLVRLPDGRVVGWLAR